MKKELVSVIVPVYNVEDYIEECLVSILNQTYKELEVICVNDCTMDNSVTIIKEFQKIDNRVKLINHTENRGLGGARNTGIRQAKGEYLLFVDSDDYLDTTAIEKLYDSRLRYDSDASVCGIMLKYEEDNTYKAHKTFHYDDWAGKKVYDLCKGKKILTDMWPSVCNKLFKTAVIKENTIFFKERLLYEDHTFYYEYFNHCNKFSYVDEPLYFYRQQRPNSITTQSVGREKEIFQVLSYIDEIFKNMYCEAEYQELIAKISVRLLYERRWVLNPKTEAYYDYLRSVEEYLRKWDKQYLYFAKDSFIEKNDPVLMNSHEIEELKKNNMTIKREKISNIKLGIKKILKKIPGIKFAVKLKYTINIINDMNYNIYRIDDKLNVISAQTENKKDIISSKIDELQAILEGIENIKIQDRISNLESNIISYKQKIEETWWLAWNIKDSIKMDGISQDDLDGKRYFPTWIPCEFPQFFQGNIWYWCDEFKKYYILNNENCDEELRILCEGLSDEDIEQSKELWDRNVKIIPYSEYVEKHGFLFNKEVIFTHKELEEQERIFREYTKIISNYVLLDNCVYEIPVFYYEHGLKHMPNEILTYISQGDILDLGGFIGDSALVLNKYTDKKVYTVDMNKSNIEKMHLVFKMNNITDKITAICGAVGNEDKMIQYYGDGSYSTVYERKETVAYEKSDFVQQYKVDTLVQKYKIEPRFMKLDVEGSEYDTINGAKEVIKSFKPVMAISIYHTPVDFLKIKPLIESWNLGYSFRIENHNPFDPVYEKMLICIPKIG